MRAYTRQYQYDKIGNVQQVKQLGTNGFTRNFVYNTGVNTLQKIEDGSNVNIQSFTYDDVGNQITAGTTRNYVWNAANELITYYNQAGSSDPTIFAQYNYSGGNRVSKMVRTGSAGSPIYERVIYIDGVFEYHILENGSTYEKNYVHIMDDKSRIAMVRIGDQFPDDITNAITYTLEDQIGSSTVRLNTTGGVIDKEEYYPFGDSSLRTFSKKRYRYVGKEKDLESGLYYYGARYYTAWTCRFISTDPLADDYPFFTPYNYAGNKPVNEVDINGMQQGGANTAPTNNTNSSSNEEKQAATNTIKKFEKSDSKSRYYFLNTFEYTKSDFANDLEDRVNNPGKTDQQSLNLCGVAVFLVAWATYDPEGYAKAAISLYETGSFTYNGWTVNANPDTFNYVIEDDKGNPMNAVDWLMMSAIRHSENSTSYDPQSDYGSQGFTTPGELNNWLNKIKCTTVEVNENPGLYIPREDAPDKKMIIYLVDWRELSGADKKATKKDKDESVIGTTLGSIFGNHYIILNSKSSVDEYNNLDISIWTWGEERKMTINKDAFLSSVKKSFTID